MKLIPTVLRHLRAYRKYFDCAYKSQPKNGITARKESKRRSKNFFEEIRLSC